MKSDYPLEDAIKFKWASLDENVNAIRLSYLDKYLIGGKILDAGCGGGAYVDLLSHKNKDVTGIEQSDELLQFIKEKKRLGHYLKANITRLPFPDKFFDSTYCFDVLEHVDDLSAISELVRVTSKRLIITVPQEDKFMNKYNLTFLHYQDQTHIRNYNYSTFKEIFKHHQCLKIKIFGELPVPIEILIRDFINELKYNVSENKISEFIYKKLLSILLNKILVKYSFKEVYTSLVAIVDL